MDIGLLVVYIGVSLRLGESAYNGLLAFTIFASRLGNLAL